MTDLLPRLVCATANPGKLAEISAILADVVELLPRPADVPDVVEDAGTLEGNARLKADAVCRATGLPAVSDDTGLFVAALGGGPGVDTAYFAGPDATHEQNRDKLLAGLRATTDRSAVFRTVAMVVWPDGRSLMTEGVCRGSIAEAERGARGWGYDPLFIPAVDAAGAPNTRTFSEMSEVEKNALSHRAKAFAALVEALRDQSSERR